MHDLADRDLSPDDVEEADELLMPMTLHVAADHRAVEDGAALPLPTISSTVFATLSVDKNGMAAVIFAAKAFTGPALLILDFDVQPLSGNLLADIGAKVREFAGARISNDDSGTDAGSCAVDWFACRGYSSAHQT